MPSSTNSNSLSDLIDARAHAAPLLYVGKRSFMLRPQMRWLLALLLVVALLFRQGLVVLLLGLLGLALLVAKLWSRYAFHGVRYSRTFSTDRAFVGDEIMLTQRIENAKLLGIASLKIDDVVPDKLEYPDQPLLPHASTNTQVLRRWTALRPYEAISWRVPIRCTRRGLYTFETTHLEAVDMFGLEERTLELANRQRLLVYPALLPLNQPLLRAQHPIGDVRAPRQLLTDPSRTAGIRDYRRDDPFKAIHWSASARRGELQTRMFEPTTSLEIAILLNLDTFEFAWQGMRYDLIEHMISLAATVATEAADDRISFGLYANGALGDSGHLLRLPASRAPGQREAALGGLAKLVAYSVLPFPALLRRIGPTLDWGATLVIISALATDELQTAVLRLARRGRRVLWLHTGDAALPTLPGVDVRVIDGAQRWARA